MSRFDLGKIDGNAWDAAAVDAVEAAINKSYQIDTFANRPASGDAQGSLFYDTTNDRVWQWLGSSWVLSGGRIPRVRAFKQATQSVPQVTITAITFGEPDVYDTDSLHNPSSNPSRITIPTGLGGVWSVGYNVYSPNGQLISTMESWLSVNGNTNTRYAYASVYSVQTTNNPWLSSSDDLVLAAGDYVEVTAYHDASSAQNFGSGGAGSSTFWATYIGPS